MDTTIYMPLTNEGTDVWRPVKARELGAGRFRIIDLEPDDEEWLFESGETVVVDGNRRIIAADKSNGN